jgi:hypothetical protein
MPQGKKKGLRQVRNESKKQGRRKEPIRNMQC